MNRTALRRDRDEDGFTLVEMSVAMLVLAVVFAALGTFLISSVKQQYSNELRAQAVQLAQQSVEEGRALPWDLTGFYADDAQAASCGTADGPVVSIAVPASKDPQVPTAGAKTVSVNGTDYTRTVCYRWIDDANDGLAGADTNGTEDVKRIEVSVDWQVKGEAQSYAVQAMRSPTSSEVAPRSATGAPAFGIVSVTPDPAASTAATIDDVGRLTAPLQFTATTSPGVSTVQLRWTAADGSAQVRTLAVGADSTSWSTTLATGTGPFAPVATTFSFTAYSATSETSTQDTKVSFSQTPGTLAISSLTATPNSLDVNSAGLTAVLFKVTATTNDDGTSGVLRYTNRSGGQVSVSMIREDPRTYSYTFPSGSGPFKDGSTTFNASITGLGGTATSGVSVTFVPPAVVPVGLVTYTVAPQACVENNNGRISRASSIDVVVEGVGASDEVTLQFNDSAKSLVKAPYVSSDGSSSTFRYELSPTSTLSFAGTSLSASVTATRKSDNTQATKLYTSSLFRRNGNETCPS